MVREGLNISNLGGVILELAKRRKTIREFSNDDVPLEDVIYAIEVAREAPSGANKQPWRFIIVRDPEKKRMIRMLCEESEKKFHESAPSWMKKWMKERNITWEKPFLTDAPYLILVFADMRAPKPIHSVWLAIGYILLALEEKGLATVTYTPSDVKWANELLKIPKNYILQAILPVGKAKKDYKYNKQPRLPLKEILFFEEYGKTLK